MASGRTLWVDEAKEERKDYEQRTETDDGKRATGDGLETHAAKYGRRRFTGAGLYPFSDRRPQTDPRDACRRVSTNWRPIDIDSVGDFHDLDVRGMFATRCRRTTRMTSAKTEKQQNRFQPGRSGNPAGRPKGARNKTTLAAQALLDGEGEKLTRKAIEMALAGDTVALRICIDRIIPPRRERGVNLDLPDIGGAGDAAPALAAIIKATANGELTPTEAKALSDMIAAYANLRAVNDASSHSHQAEIEAAAAEFDRRIALRIEARRQMLAVDGVASNET